MNRFGQFINSGSYEKRKIRVERHWYTLWIHPTVIFLVTQDPVNPCTYLDRYGIYHRSNKVFESDEGSCPWLVELIIPDNLYPDSFNQHDSEYKFKGDWQSNTYEGPYKFVPSTRLEADDRLHDAVGAEGGSPCHQDMIWDGVRLGGWMSYGKGDHRKGKLRDVGKDILK